VKQLCSYYSFPEHEDDIQNTGKTLPEFLQAYGMDGIELLMYRSEPYLQSFSDSTVGAHLRFWNSWLPLWYQDQETLLRIFKDTATIEKVYGGTKRAAWLLQMKRNIQAATLEKPEYLVMHVAEANREELFTYDFHYSDEKVLKTMARAFNKLADAIPDQVTVLFENLWWPGLRLTDPEAVAKFFELIERKNVGIMLDTGHLMNTNPDLTTEQEGIDYVCQTVKNLGATAKLIKGLHLNCSLSGKYLKRALVKKPPQDLSAANCLKHVCALDQHHPFTDPAVQKILELVAPEYVVHELAHKDAKDYEKQLLIQLKTLGLHS
jgi:sugar phosphate isomerase/epimerase